MICIIAAGRSGSNALRSILRQENWISCMDEVMGPGAQRTRPGNLTEFLDRMLRLMPEWKLDATTADVLIEDYFSYLQNLALDNVPLIDIKDENLGILDWPGVYQSDIPRTLRRIMNKDYPIIRMTRHNWLAQYASQQLARQTNEWIRNKKKTGKNQITKIHIDPERIMDTLGYFEYREKRGRRWLSDYPRTAWLHYEKLFDGSRLSSSARTEIERVVGRSLDSKLTVRTQKIAPKLEELVENFDEIREILKGTPYEKFLETEN